jgi:hypothetical protein
MSEPHEEAQNGLPPQSRTYSIEPAGLDSSPNYPRADRHPAAEQSSIYSLWLTLDIPEPLVRGPGISWNSAAGPRQPSRSIGFSE